jgi:hypothetical protein
MRGDDGSGDAIEIVAGLTPGMRIVKTDLGSLPAGAEVRITGAAGTAADTIASGTGSTRRQ